MSLRMPQNLKAQLGVETGASALDSEIRAEKAVSLGRAGRRVESAMALLGAMAAGDGKREAAVLAAAGAVHDYFIQRELCGFRDHAAPVADYAITGEVLARVGARA